MADSPYVGLPPEQWMEKTRELARECPLRAEEMMEVVLQAWKDIFDSRLGPKAFKIGKDIFPQPQIMAFLLHELIPLELATRYPQQWRRDLSGADKDIVYIPDERFSLEIKTSSSASGIFGNRSYAQPTLGNKKSKSGYYLAVNFDGFDEKGTELPTVHLIRFGWFDHTDWIGQKAASGQQSHPTPLAKAYKLLTLYPAKSAP
jgi:hypothetical protein